MSNYEARSDTSRATRQQGNGVVEQKAEDKDVAERKGQTIYWTVNGERVSGEDEPEIVIDILTFVPDDVRVIQQASREAL